MGQHLFVKMMLKIPYLSQNVFALQMTSIYRENINIEKLYDVFWELRMDEDVKCFHNFLKGILKRGFVNKKKILDSFSILFIIFQLFFTERCIFLLKRKEANKFISGLSQNKNVGRIKVGLHYMQQFCFHSIARVLYFSLIWYLCYMFESI